MKMWIFDLAALGAAFCVALSNLIAPSAIRHFGPAVFNCWRLGAALVPLVLLTTLRGSWTLLPSWAFLALLVSSFIGIVVGDSMVYAAMRGLGPRRTAVLYATSAPFAAVLGFLVFSERLPVSKVVGIALVFVGVWLAIAYRDAEPMAPSGAARGGLIPEVLFGLTGGFCAALAALIARPAMAAGVDPFAAASIRAAAGLVGLGVLTRARAFSSETGVTARMLVLAMISGLLGMAAGMTLVLFALSMQPTGIVTTLASTTPVLLLPLLWLASRKRPGPKASIGAALAVAGVAALAGEFV
jgi:drug/metabolite transporter (DMT)-like permease